MKALTKEESPGHQKSLSSKALVWKCLACPVVGALCIKWVMACCSCGGIYMRPLKYRWPFVMCQSSIDKQGNRGEPSFKDLRA